MARFIEIEALYSRDDEMEKDPFKVITEEDTVQEEEEEAEYERAKTLIDVDKIALVSETVEKDICMLQMGHRIIMVGETYDSLKQKILNN